MKSFLIKEGSPVVAVKYDDVGCALLVHKTTKRDSTQFAKDVEVDPMKHLVKHRVNTLKSKWEGLGYYGFLLPANDRGYQLMLVHSSHVNN